MKPFLFFSILVLLITACGTAATEDAGPVDTTPASGSISKPPGATPTDKLEGGSTRESGASRPSVTPTLLSPDEPPPLGAEREFRTDFSKHSVPYSEILSGGPPKDGIPAIDNPAFVSVAEADAWLKPQEPVVFFQLGNDARAYPIQILIWHEIVNDEVNGVPVVITFCPLCNTAIAFERTVNGQVLDFGTTGRLRFSNLIMYDRQTESWWQQATGEAIVGKLTGTRLKFLPASIISWEEFKTTYPDGKVLSRETGYSRPYGQNPYAGYDDINQRPFLYRGPETPDKLPPMARVLTVDLNGEAVAYPYQALEEQRVVNDTVGGQPIVVLWQPGTASPLDSAVVGAGRDVGTADAFFRTLDGQVLTFVFRDGRILDEETSSEWTVLGEAVDGPLAGKRLERAVAINHFWFSWAAFRPETRVYGLGE